MTINETADYLRVKVHTLHQWRYRRFGPPVIKVGAHLRYDRAAVDRWLEQRTATAGESTA